MKITNCINQKKLKRLLKIPNGNVSTTDLMRISSAVIAIEDYLVKNTPQIETTNTMSKAVKSGDFSILKFSSFMRLYGTKRLLTSDGFKSWKKLNKELRGVVRG